MKEILQDVGQCLGQQLASIGGSGARQNIRSGEGSPSLQINTVDHANPVPALWRECNVLYEQSL